ncbi:4'-phosphopantetheinyl transferase family protein [Paracoccus ravus]|uniref:4'-phosphopantetheinyl transferase family protein n=1 Tax=Paracoccus ravus TaxID=2447760 RepID=UPI00106E8B15|nr:4-phosphopantetheinyl transferase [Paracoccus ravus]
MTAQAEALRALALRLLPKGYGVAVLPMAMPTPVLLAAEHEVVARAVPNRRHEFAVGRLSLRLALAEAGQPLDPDRPILPDADRRPDLPLARPASLSHAGRFCIAVASPLGGPSIGVDLEPEDTEPIPGLGQMISPCRMLPQMDPLLGFCVKEAMYKAQFPVTRRMLDFADVPVVIRDRRAKGCLGRRLIAARWGRAAGHYLAISLWRG